MFAAWVPARLADRDKGRTDGPQCVAPVEALLIAGSAVASVALFAFAAAQSTAVAAVAFVCYHACGEMLLATCDGQLSRALAASAGGSVAGPARPRFGPLLSVSTTIALIFGTLFQLAVGPDAANLEVRAIMRVCAGVMTGVCVFLVTFVRFGRWQQSARL